MKEKSLMTSFYLANTADLLVTLHAVTQLGFAELNGWASEFFANNAHDQVIMTKMAVTIFLVGLYALVKNGGTRWAFPVEKSLQIGNAIVWSVVIFNLAQVLTV